MKKFVVLILIILPSFLNKTATTQREIFITDEILLKTKNYFFLVDFFKGDIVKAEKYWQEIDSGGLKRVVIVNIEKQELNVLEFIDTFCIIINTKVSAGLKKGWTPTGEFEIIKKKLSRISIKWKGTMLYWNGITDDEKYAIHGLKNNKEYEKYLGQPKSHGCIRISNSISKIFYDTVPIGTKVIIE